MPKKQNLDAKFMDWAEGVPQDIIDKFLSSSGAEQIANLHGGMTKAQQRAAELEAKQQRVAELETWANQHQDLYTKIPEWASTMRSRKVEEVEQALSGTKKEIEQQALDLNAAFEAGDLPYEKAAPMLLALRERYHAVNAGVEEFRKFKETEVPQLVGAVEKNLEVLRNRQDNSNRALLEYVVEAVDYVRAHPDRSARKIYDTFVERNKDRQYKTFQEIAQDTYADEDTDALIEQRAAEKLVAQQKANTTSNEAPITGSAIGPYHRRQTIAAPPPPTTAAGVRTKLMEHFQRTG